MTGINIIGMPFGLHGLGLEMRDKVWAMKHAGIDVCILNENYSSLARQIRDPRIDAMIVDKPVHDINLFCHNLPAIGLIKSKKPEIFEGRYNIAAPYWEFPQLPERHARSLQYLDEIWVSTDFLKACFEPHTDLPVRKMPLHMDIQKAAKSRLGALTRKKAKPLVFGYVFDFNSMAARKDPMILVAAFLECFAALPKADVKLTIKYKVEPSPLVRQRDIDDLVALAAMDPRIELIDTPLSVEEMGALYESFDVYVSPHRAEGLGRGICEMMLRGKAVAATGYSGPAEFLTPDCALKLDYYTSHVGAAALGDIKSHFTWAEVQMESVIGTLRQFADDPDLAPRLGRNAIQHMTDGRGLEPHGRACRDRLESIGNR
jgi:glycosyltransferase involved in cell wall biosynthesis